MLTNTLPQPLDLTEFERSLACQALEHHTGFAWDFANTGPDIETQQQAKFAISALESFIKANLEDGNDIGVYAALHGRISYWKGEHFPDDWNWSYAKILEREA